MEHFYQLAIIGAGPAGIATAIESYVLGMRDIVLLEKDENHNATIRKFYKDNKRVDKDWKGQKVELDGTLYFMDGTKESTLDFFDQLLDNEVVELKTHTEVQKIMKIEGGFEVFIAGGSIKAAYVVVTIGRMGKPNKPDYKIPPSIKNQIHFTLDGCSQGEKVMVVGGGDSAIEYAVELCDRNEVSICYRRGTFRRANPTNQTDIEKAVANGSVRPLLNTEIIELESESGKVKVLFSDGSSELFDRLVYAIGGTTPSGFLQSSGIREEDGKPVHDENYQSNVEGLFVAGDITQESGGSIALGLNHGFAIANYIQSL
ncbi:NAD(P)-binding domain-containing protein [Sulfuricurvum sp. RIFCSPLOWO2_12_FULL_43_24]|uniref:NAD(P)-binding domain-containing protein n=1 Tax=Sulfuricurvum sp. RIFCSPLOWO2_12_FULL_43_24 TaxID=1802247 RepID=UPI0008AF37DB|nr:NAD(P)-binding domain-containing protein [Sulfuricurvum sp. RIFCSPLOWO2_12_FULL_43_24]OHD89862.1 MAG: pyridine nucleotide-disulfide oxidoreductase [Sulfuricurvum sp. RIFCSPLOWO2_12_43_5]OHD90044.1 MAG: pyridine nucleotide-disulfide oxidoreductase [Sulfuricurvum sp. RIFCSPLOWO2_12_FULL_43_24]